MLPEHLSMEYVDGATLLGVLQERGPLELKLQSQCCVNPDKSHTESNCDVHAQ